MSYKASAMVINQIAGSKRQVYHSCLHLFINYPPYLRIIAAFQSYMYHYGTTITEQADTLFVVDAELMLVTYYRFAIPKSRNQSKSEIFANIDGIVMNHLN